METYKKIINGKEVEFEPEFIVDKHGHSNEWAMTGYTDGEPTHTASGSYTYFDEFEDISDIEEITKN